ncbi:MAG: rhodanese-like domain-containing protein [Phycicoccus sp.]
MNDHTTPHGTTTPTAGPPDGATTVDAGWLAARLAAGDAPRVLDVRTPAEFESVHVPGSYNLPLDTLREHREEIARHLDEEVVLLCRSGHRAAQAERALVEAGLSRVHVLQGGMTAYQAAGGAVVRGPQRWDLERQVRLVVGTVVLVSVLLGAVVEPVTWVAGAVGAGLAVAALTDSCLLGALLARLPYNRSASRDPRVVVEQLAGTGSPGARE